MNLLSLDQTLKALVEQLAREFGRLRHRPILAPDFSAFKLLRRSSWGVFVEGARLSQR